MNLRKVGAYNIGLDIGTGSVGWAVTDSNGELCHFNKKPTWGSRLFPSAETAADTRINRGQRRRYDRRRQRLDLLQELFSKNMEEIDPEFFIRLNQSRLHIEDRKLTNTDYKWPLFNGDSFNEVEYYKRFPTIYHLRKWLMETDEKADIRLIYLAFHNIVKHRGNFLQQDKKGLSAESASVKDAVEELCLVFQEWCDINDIDCSVTDNIDDLINVLSDTDASKSRLKERIIPLLSVKPNEVLDSKAAKALSTAVASAIVGTSAELRNVFYVFDEKPEDLTTKIYLSNDEQVEVFEERCPDESLVLFEAMKKVYSSVVLQEILSLLPGHFLSENKVAEYKRYSEDLATLKRLVKQFKPESYDEFFRGALYERIYPGEKRDYDVSKAKGYTLYNAKRNRSYDDFKKDVEKLFKGSPAESDSRYLKMMDAFNEQKFLRRLKSSDNGSIPYQLHLEEMNQIIEKQQQYYPFLAKDKDKLNALVSFRIPYYVGPLTTKNARTENGKPEGKKRFAWAVRKEGMENEKIYPWNWDEVIDKNASAEEFIKRMTGTCTYIQGEPVLSKNSLLYQEFCVLNELNGAYYTQDGDKHRRFDYKDRSDIVDELFKNGSVSYKKLADWMTRRGHANVHVTGGQGEKGFESRLSSYIFFKKDIFGIDDIPESYYPMIEEIILWSTLFEDRNILKEKLKEKYGNQLSDDQIKKICRKRMTGWGKLSKKLLTGIKANTDDGPRSVMDIMREGDPTNGHGSRAMVLMEVLHDDKLAFSELIDAINKEKFDSVEEIIINDLPGSPALRRGINQAMKIVKEIAGIAGQPPENIFIEVTRSDDDKRKGQRTKRRYEDLKDNLNKFKEDNPDFYEARLKDELSSISHGDLNEKLTLYFMQGGKSLYSGKPLEIDRLSEYEVDHILPQSYIKDDSFENKALVLKEENQRKSDQMLLPADMRREMASYWKALQSAKLIGEKKLRNLLRDGVSDKQLKGFINRQIVETSQIIKTVQMVLSSIFPETDVLPVKAGLSSELRRELGLVKCREVNDFHHAHDALLASEIGRFIKVRYPDMYTNPLKYQGVIRSYIKGESKKVKSGYVPYGSPFIISSFLRSGFDEETGEIKKDTWNAPKEAAKLKRYFDYRQCYITHMPEETCGAFWDATIYSPHDVSMGSKLKLELKKGLEPKKYGGYSSEQFAYFFIYEVIENGTHKLVFDAIPVSVAQSIVKNSANLILYGERKAMESGNQFIRIVRSKLYKYQKLEINNSEVYLTAKDEVRNGTEVAFSNKQVCVIAKLVKALDDGDVVDVDEGYIANVYETVITSIKKYSPRLAKALKLETWKDTFFSLRQAEQSKVIMSILELTNAKKNKVDLTSIGLAKTSGQLKTTFNKVLNQDGLVVIDQSITGMYERREHIGL